MMDRFKKFPLLVAVMLSGGCSSFWNIGDEIEECSMNGRGTPCISARAAYYASEGYDPDDNPVFAGMEEKRSIFGKRKRNRVSPFFPEPVPSMAAADEPKPLLMPAKVLRVWVNSYEDEKGNLVYPTKVFSQVESRKWNTGYSLKRSNSGKERRITPLVSSSDNSADKQATAVIDEGSKQINSSTQQNPTAIGGSTGIPDSLPQGVLTPPLQ